MGRPVTFDRNSAKRVGSAVRRLEGTPIGRPEGRTAFQGRAWINYQWARTPSGGISAASASSTEITPASADCNPYTFDPATKERNLDIGTTIEVFNYWTGDVAGDTNIRIGWNNGIWEVIGEDCGP